MSEATAAEPFFDVRRWQACLGKADSLCGAGLPVALLRSEDFARGCGTMLLLTGDGAAAIPMLTEYDSACHGSLGLLLVADGPAVAALLDEGWTCLPALVRRGALRAFVLRTLDELEAAGLAEFVDDLGLVFPRH